MKIKKIIPAIIVLIPMAFNLHFFVLSGSLGVDRISSLIVSLFFLTLLFLMVYTGKVYKYRSIFFITLALCFFPSFISNLVASRGHVALSDLDVIKNEIPFCHIVIPFSIVPYALTETLIFPARIFNHYTSVYSMLLIWLLSSLFLGRGWCSWICFYGGWDELFSRVGKKKVIKTNPSSNYARYFNFIMLIFIVLVSLKTLSVVYCEWFCPFKLITEYSDPSSLIGFIQFILMVVFFMGLLVILPILTKKRIQCASFCPFGAFQSFFNKISPFRIKIDKDKCIGCMKCVNKCPTFSLTKESIDKGEPHITCTLCSKCIDECPTKAISYKFSFLKKQMKTDGVLYTILSPKTFYTYAALLIGSIIGSGFMTDTLSMFINFIIGGGA